MSIHLIRVGGPYYSDPATKTKLLELFNKLKNENDGDTLNILVIGKRGVGKSSTVNSIFGRRLIRFQPPWPVIVQCSKSDFTLNIIETPGLVQRGLANNHAITTVKRFLLNKTIDVLLYFDRLDADGVDNLDKQIIRMITDSFGKGVWQRAAIVLSHAQLDPPDAFSYEEFSAKRSEAILELVREEAGLNKPGSIESEIRIPVVLVENSGKCNKNSDGDKILPNGIPWTSNLIGTIGDIASNGSKPVLIDGKLIHGSNPFKRYIKYIVPLLLAVPTLDQLMDRMRSLLHPLPLSNIMYFSQF